MAETMNDNLKNLLEGLDTFMVSKSIVGTPVTVNDCTIIPITDMTLGVGVGGGKENNGGGLGAKLTPSCVLLLQKDGAVKLMSIQNQDAITKALDMIPTVIDKLTGKTVKPDPAVDATVKDMAEETKDTSTAQEVPSADK